MEKFKSWTDWIFFFFFFFWWKSLKRLIASQISSSSQLIVLASSTQSWCSSPLLWIAHSDCLSLFDWALEWRMWPCVYLHSRTWLVRGHSKSQINSAPEGWGGSQKKETLKITTLHQCGAYEIKPPPEHVRLHVLLFFFSPSAWLSWMARLWRQGNEQEGKSVHEWANVWVKKKWAKGKRTPPRTASETAELMERQRAQMGQYLNEGLHIAVKQLTVKNGARSRLPHSLGFRGKSGGPGEMVVGGYGWYMIIMNNNATGLTIHHNTFSQHFFF